LLTDAKAEGQAALLPRRLLKLASFITTLWRRFTPWDKRTEWWFEAGNPIKTGI
jgi:hypothetical protein